MAGCAAGAATTSMYVAGLSVLMPLVAVMLERGFERRERIDRWFATSCGLGLTMLLTMPAFVFHPRMVWRDISAEARIYSSRHSGSYLSSLTNTRQFGALLGTLAVVGLVVLLRSRASRPLAVAWIIFAASYLGFLLRYDFEPAQSLLPIYPFLLVAAGVAVAWSYQRIRARWPRWASRAVVGIVVIASLATSLFSGTVSFASGQVLDSRTRAAQWLQHKINGHDVVVVAAELAFLPTQLQHLGARIEIVPSQNVPAMLVHLHPTYAVTGRGAAFVRTLANNNPVPAAHFGHTPTPTDPNLWRTNNEIIAIYHLPNTNPS
jgi:hypothetical protein